MTFPEDQFDEFADSATSYAPVEWSPPAQRIRYRYEADDGYDDQRPSGLSPARRWLLIIITLIVITALVATTILPGLLAARYNNARQTLPPPTTLPRI
jgi:hypothetical protein